MIDIAVFELYPNARQVELKPNDEYEVKDAQGNIIEVDDTAVRAKASEIQAIEDAKQYQRDRASAYPSIQDQLDMQYWDSVNGTTTWKDKITEVKTTYPKE